MYKKHLLEDYFKMSNSTKCFLLLVILIIPCLSIVYSQIKGSNSLSDVGLEVNTVKPNPVSENTFFYLGKFGLYSKLVGVPPNRVQKYGYVSEEGEVMISFQFDEATSFSNRDGFARVKKGSKPFLLDTLGNLYSLATKYEELDLETEALDMHGNWGK
ncbi:MAG: WG repeat-containing protein [Bacteroidota bacterium]